MIFICTYTGNLAGLPSRGKRCMLGEEEAERLKINLYNILCDKEKRTVALGTAVSSKWQRDLESLWP